MKNTFLNKVKDLRDDLTNLLVEKDEMLTIGYQRLNADYARHIGKYEIHLYEREYEYFRLKKKIDHIKSSHEKGDFDIDLYSLDQKLDRDYQDYKHRIESRRRAGEESQTYLTKDEPREEDYTKAKDLYWNITREFHPDLNNIRSSANKELWVKANRAFENLDLAKLESYALSLSYMDFEREDEEMEVLIKHLQRKINEAKAYIGSLGKVHPYNKINILKDINELEKKKQGIIQATIEVDGKISDLENKMLDLLIK